MGEGDIFITLCSPARFYPFIPQTFNSVSSAKETLGENRWSGPQGPHSVPLRWILTLSAPSSGYRPDLKENPHKQEDSGLWQGQ